VHFRTVQSSKGKSTMARSTKTTRTARALSFAQSRTLAAFRAHHSMTVVALIHSTAGDERTALTTKLAGIERNIRALA